MKQNRTKTAIAAAFTQLLSENSIERITVKMITDTVGCSRKTFYYYFTDVYNLAQFICEQRCEEFVANHTDVHSMREGFLTLVNFFKDDRHVIRNMFHGYGTESLQRFIQRMTLDYTRKFITTMPYADRVPTAQLEGTVHMYGYMLFGILVDWLGSDDTGEYIQTFDLALQELPFLLQHMAQDN